MLRLPTALLVILLVLGTHSTIRYYVYDSYYRFDDYQCLKQKVAATPVVVSLETGLSAIDGEEIQNIKYAKTAGLTVDVFLSSCRTRPVEVEIDFIIKSVGEKMIDKFWVYPFSFGGKDCSWNKQSPAENCIYLQNFTEVAPKKYGIEVGFVTDIDTWTTTFGSATFCPQLKNSELWWIPTMQEQNFKQNFVNYHQIGGWVKPTMKTYYTEATICMFDVIAIYRP